MCRCIFLLQLLHLQQLLLPAASHVIVESPLSNVTYRPHVPFLITIRLQALRPDRRYELSVSVTRESGQLFSRSLLVSAQSPHLLSRDLIADSTGRHRVHVSLKEEGAEEVEEEQQFFFEVKVPEVIEQSMFVDDHQRLLLHKFPFTSTSLIVIVPTSLDARGRRDPIRKQWSKTAIDGQQAVLFFVVGEYERVNEEISDRKRGDFVSELEATWDMLITSCPDYDESYSSESKENYYWGAVVTSSTTCKMFEACRFLSSNFNFRYLIRIGDDAYFNVQLFLDSTFPSSRLYLGRFNWPSPHQPILSAMDLYGIREWPQYAIGAGYILSHDVVRLVAQLEASGIPLRKTAPEDVIFALWLMPFEIPRMHTPHIFNHPDMVRASDPNRGFCSVESLIVHYVKEEHFQDVRQSDGVMLCRQQHDKNVQFSFAGGDLDRNHGNLSDLGEIRAGDTHLLRIVAQNISMHMSPTLLVHVFPAGQVDFVFLQETLYESSETQVMFSMWEAGEYEVEVTIMEGKEELWGHPRWKKTLTVR